MPLYTDQLGQPLQLDQTPQRIISLVPSQTELLHYWGLGERVVGLTKFCIHPEAWYRGKQRVGGTKTVKMDAVAALQPDLIIGNKEENSQGDIEALQQQYKVWMTDLYQLEDVWEMMQRLGAVLKVEEQAEMLIQQLKADFLALKEAASTVPKRRVAYFIWRKPYMVAANNTFIDNMLLHSGFENVFSDKERYPEVTLEDLQAAQPEVILLSSEPYPFKPKHQEELAAVCPNAKILLVDGELFSWYGSRLLYFCDYIKKLWQQLGS